jgi:hypothetical protein
MNKLEINGIQNLKGFAISGWEIYHIEERPASYFLKLRPERGPANAHHAAVQFDRAFVMDGDMLGGGKKVHTIIAYVNHSTIIHEENVYFDLFKNKTDLWQGIANLIEQKGAKIYGR